jgi:AcrR family transcriptional regulator
LAADPAQPVRRQRNSGKTKGDILAAARAEFCAHGFGGARVDAIAERAGANKRLHYHCFGNKEDLRRAVLLDACLGSVSTIQEREAQAVQMVMGNLSKRAE